MKDDNQYKHDNLGQGSYYVGTDLKFKIDITAEGFDQTQDDFEIKVVCGSKTQIITQDDIVEDEDGQYILIDTSQFNTGLVKLIVTAKVPDENFNEFPWNGYRREVTVHELCYIKKP